MSSAVIDSMGGLKSRDFSRLAQFIEGYSGIKIPPTKKSMVEGRLRRRLRALGLADMTDYCRYLFDQNGLEAEAVYVIDAVSTNKTDFFREPQHFHFLTAQALPELLRHQMIVSGRPIKAWSAASSIGAEAYTIAMVLADFVEKNRGVDFSIFATDICTEVLQQGVRAIYAADMVEPIPKDLRHRYLLRARDAQRQEVRVVPKLRAKVKFSHLNLMDDTYAMPRDMDLVFCRNVLIYFDKPTQGKVLSRLCSHLRPGGYLFLGHSETLSGHGLPVRQVGNAVFVKTE
ncbi:MAG TPA: CheR family methyltransferase [Patescibacteria group bacterium]|nr:CheR family methyltransferase [Patescibacteria group bacterium]